jgi:hypothetical protein
MQTDEMVNISVKEVLMSLKQIGDSKAICKQFSIDLLDKKEQIDIWATCKNGEIFLFASKAKLIRFVGEL